MSNAPNKPGGKTKLQKFYKHASEMDLEKIRSKDIPAWVWAGGEKSYFAGPFIECPCLDCYAPNCSCRFCIPPIYNAQYYEFTDFFEGVLPQLRTGDLVLCCWPREDGLIEAKCITHSKWSHAGIVYRPSDCPSILKQKAKPDHGGDPSRPLICQMLNTGDPKEKAYFMDDFEQNMKDYLDKHTAFRNRPDGKTPDDFEEFQVGVRFLRNVKRDEAFYQAVEKIVISAQEKTYAMNDMTGFDLCQFMPCCQFQVAGEDPSTVFCSEFVAQAYQEAGLINKNRNPAEFSPSQFDSSRGFNLCMFLNTGGSFLSKEHVVIGPRSLEDRKKAGYKGDPGFLSKEGEGVWGVDISKPVAMPIGFDAQQAPAQNTMKQPLLG